MTLSPDSPVAVGQYSSQTLTRRRITLLLCITGVISLLAGCHESDAGNAPSTLSPLGVTSRSAKSSAADSVWDTYSALVTIHFEGGRYTSPTADDASFHLTRTLQADSTWQTTVYVLPKKNGLKRAASDTSRQLDRVEIGAEGIKGFDEHGTELVQRGDVLAKKAAAAHAKHPGDGPFPLVDPGSMGESSRVPKHKRDGQSWRDIVFAGPAAGARALVRQSRHFGGDPERIGALFRYVRTLGDVGIEVLVDSLTGVPMEVKQTRGGTLAVHVVHSYDHLADGSNVLRQTRIERAGVNGEAPAITVTRFDSITFSRQGAGR